MGAGLDQYLVAEITKRFKGRLVVVLNLEDSDAILIGDTREDYWGRTFAPRTVSVLDKDGRVVLWSAPVDYRRGWWSWQPRRPKKVAERLVRNLKKAIDQAERGR